MRQVLIQVPVGGGEAVTQAASKVQALQLAAWPAARGSEQREIILGYISNSKIEGFFDELEGIAGAEATVIPNSVLPIAFPSRQSYDQVTDVELLSPGEIYLSGLKSIGSWKGFLGYAVTAAVVTWFGLRTNSVFLLVAGMLIAPFAGPAMNTAIGAASGNRGLLLSSLWRYVAAIGVSVATALALTLAFGFDTPTRLMSDIGNITAWSVLLPLAAGAAGGLHLIQSRGDSLVSGAGVGVLVAASLAPPAALIGMALALARWSLIGSAAYLIALQLVGINLAATLVFLSLGLSREAVRFKPRQPIGSWLVLGLTALALTGLLALQFSSGTRLNRESDAGRASQLAAQTLQEIPQATLLQTDSRVVRLQGRGRDALVLELQTLASADAPADLAQVIRARVRDQLAQGLEHLIPLVEVTLLHEQAVLPAARASSGISRRRLRQAGEAAP